MPCIEGSENFAGAEQEGRGVVVVCCSSCAVAVVPQQLSRATFSLAGALVPAAHWDSQQRGTPRGDQWMVPDIGLGG